MRPNQKFEENKPALELDLTLKHKCADHDCLCGGVKGNITEPVPSPYRQEPGLLFCCLVLRPSLNKKKSLKQVIVFAAGPNPHTATG